MEASLPIVPESTNKREQIIKLLSEGNHSTKNIARIVGTTEAYVWKEKSKLKTRGFLISRDTEVISKTSQLNIYSNNTLLSVPQLDTEGLKKLYSEFGTGKKPAEIIAENGFHPELVENEYQRFSRLTGDDVAALQRKFFLDFNQGLATNTNNNNTTKPLVEKYNKDGKLTIDEFITLIKLMLNEKYKVGKDSVIHNITNGILPDGWKVETCINCNKPITAAMMHPTKKLRITISDSYNPMAHPSCRGV
jgi:biotin operon repressor